MDYKDTKDDISTDESCYINDSLPVHRSLSKQSNSIKKLKQLRATRGASFSKDLPTRFNSNWLFFRDKYTNILVSPELQKSAEDFISNNPHGLNGNQIKDVAKEFCIYFSMISTKHPNVVPLEDILIPNYDDNFLDVIVQKLCFLGQSDFVPVFGTVCDFLTLRLI
ncbi:hypothetical protein RF11_07891 [Thelohanellus kitauei]|uniref:Uncharacterized protein n=1 Tax=Thelohanellus kitauei TaxID=669202 RepID=A0A0C2M883_THEKT|nr:hypothetical protein RF11_07891 [Thelohanellus kitauei]